MYRIVRLVLSLFYFGFRVLFFNDPATTEIYTLSLHDALPIFCWMTWPLSSTSTIRTCLPVVMISSRCWKRGCWDWGGVISEAARDWLGRPEAGRGIHFSAPLGAPWT